MLFRSEPLTEATKFAMQPFVGGTKTFPPKPDAPDVAKNFDTNLNIQAQDLPALTLGSFPIKSGCNLLENLLGEENSVQKFEFDHGLQSHEVVEPFSVALMVSPKQASFSFNFSFN